MLIGSLHDQLSQLSNQQVVLMGMIPDKNFTKSNMAVENIPSFFNNNNNNKLFGNKERLLLSKVWKSHSLKFIKYRCLYTNSNSANSHVFVSVT